MPNLTEEYIEHFLFLVESEKTEKIRKCITENPSLLQIDIGESLKAYQWALDSLNSWNQLHEKNNTPRSLRSVQRAEDFYNFIRDETILLAIKEQDIELLEHMHRNKGNPLEALSDGRSPQEISLLDPANSEVTDFFNKKVRLAEALKKMDERLGSVSTLFSNNLTKVGQQVFIQQQKSDLRAAESSELVESGKQCFDALQAEVASQVTKLSI